MASSNFSGLKELLSPPPTSENMPITKTLNPLDNSSSPSDSDIAQEFEELSVESNVKLSPPQGFSSSPPSPLSDYVLPEMKIVENDGKKKVEYENSGENGIYPEGIDGDNEKKQLSGRRCFPPPISCLRKVKVGKPFKYVTYEKESESYVVEEIKIPNGSLFHASREDGRLKLCINFSDEEE